MGDDQQQKPTRGQALEAGRRSSGARLVALLVPAVLLIAGIGLVASSGLLTSITAPPAPVEPPITRREPPRSPPAPPERRAQRPADPTPPRTSSPPLAGPADPLPAPGTASRPSAPPSYPELRLPEAAPPAGTPRAEPPAATEPGPPAIQTAVPITPWKTLDPSTRLDRIAVGSCLNQAAPQPIWRAVLAKQPQLMLMIGDNVYGDVKSADLAELAEAYRIQARHPDFAKVRASVPVLGIWDDQDYGRNDAGASFEHRAGAARLFREYWGLDSTPGDSDGVYYARILGPEGARVQIIMLDTRSQRSPWRAKGPSFPHWGKYEPDPDPAKTMLGTRQWAWLGVELSKPAEIRILVSSIQVLAEGHGFERWGNLPRERDRLMQLIRATGAKGVILLSGDRHAGALYNRSLAAGQLLPELTASSLNRPYGPSRDAASSELLMQPYHLENFGLIEIDWQARKVRLGLHGMGGESVEALTIRFADLGLAP